MLLPSPAISGQPESLDHLTTLTHEGKVLIFAASHPVPGQPVNFYYTVRRDGYEDRSSSTPAQLDNWENWKPLPFLDENPDQSVVANEVKTLSVTVSSTDTAPDWVAAAPQSTPAGPVLVYRSVYSNPSIVSPVLPVQVISALGYIYTFRQFSQGTLLVDRYVLDGLTNTLIRKLDVRYRRSRQRLAPLAPTQASSQDVIDGLDYRDANGLAFYEPAIQLNFLTGGECAVVFAESTQADENYWHFFMLTDPAAGKFRLVSVRASKDGLFDVNDPTGGSGLLRRSLVLQDASGQAVGLTGPPAATLYNKQKLGTTRDGQQQLLRDSVHVMLALSTASGIVALSFAVRADGTLAQISDRSPVTSVTLHSSSQEVTLPPSTLQDVTLLDPAAQVAQGKITAIANAPDGNTVLTLQTDTGSAPIPANGTIRIDGSGGYNGNYSAAPVSLGVTAQALAQGDDTVQLTTPLAQSLDVGSRIRINVPVVTGIVHREPFDVQLTQAAPVGAVGLKVSVPHLPAAAGIPVTALDLVDVAAPGSNVLGTWTQVADPQQASAQPGGRKIDLVSLTGDKLRMRSQGANITNGEAVQIDGAQALDGFHSFRLSGPGTVQLTDPWDGGELVELQAAGRIGLQFRGAGDFVSVAPGAFSLSGSFTIEAWIKTTLPDVALLSVGSKVMFLAAGKLGFNSVATPGTTIPIADGRFHHVAVTFNSDSGKIAFYVDGQQDSIVSASNSTDAPNSAILIGQAPSLTPDPNFTGTLAELRVWETARSQADVANFMNVPLTGREVDLAGYWRLTSIVESDPRTVTDFTPRDNHGTVSGDPFVSDAVLSRDLGNGRLSSGFVSTQFFDAGSGATYEESFEFQLDDGTHPAPDPPFDFQLFGKSSADSFQSQDIDKLSGQPQFSPVVANQPFRTVTCRFVVPDNISVVRAFGIQAAQGTWVELHVRNHRVRLVASSITDSLISESITVPASSLPAQEAAQLRTTYEGLEISEQLLLGGQASADDLIRQANNLFAKIASPFNYWCQIGAVNSQPDVRLGIGPFPPSGSRVLQLTSGQPAVLVRFEPMPEGGTSLIPDRDISATGPACAIVSAQPATQDEVHSLFLGTLARVLTDAELPLLALDSSSSGTATIFLDAETVRGRLSAEHRATFDQQTADHVSSVELGIRPTQLWHLENVNPEGKLVSTDTGTADLARPFTWGCNIGTPTSEPGSQTFLEPAGDHLVLGTVADLLIAVPSFDLSPFVDGEAPRAGRPVNKTIANSLVALQKQLDGKLSQLQALGFHGVVSAGSSPAERLAAMRTDLADAARTYVAKREMSQSEQTLSLAGAPRVSVTALGPAPSTGCRTHLIDSADGQVALTFLESETLTLQNPIGTSQSKNLEFRQYLFDTTKDATNELGAWSLKPLPTCLNLQPGALEIQGGPDLSGPWSAECWLFVPNNPGSAQFLQLSGPQGGSISLPSFQLQGASPVGAVTPPSIVSVTPNNSLQGIHLTGVVITGVATHFTQGTPIVTFSRRGVTATAPQVTDDTHLTVTLDIRFDAEAGACDVAVSTGAENAAGTAVFSVTPALTTVIPPNGPTGQATAGVAITGLQTHFDQKTTTVSFSVPGVTASNIQVVDGTHLTLTVNITSAAPTGPVDVTVVTGRESATGHGFFAVGSGTLPSIAGVNPGNVQRGQTLPNVLITGTSTHFTNGSPSVTFANQGIAASSVRVTDDTHLTATLTIASDADIGPGAVTVVTGSERAVGSFTVSFISVGWHHFATVTSGTGSGTGQTSFYLDGVPVGGVPLAVNGQLTRIGAAGKLAEVRIWSTALSDEEVEANYIAGITGHEPDLAAYYPLDGSTANLAPGQPANYGVVTHNVDFTRDTLPFPAGSGRLREAGEIVTTTPVSAEYATFAVDPVTGNNTAWLRRFFAAPGKNGTYLFAQKRVEELDLVWIGNAQYAPTLLGYIEGAPPVPSENLTVNPDSYAGATSVTLSQSEEVEYSWSQSKESKLGTDIDFFLGVETEVLEGAAALEFFGIKALSFKLGAKGSLALSRSEAADSTVSTSVTISSTDRIELRGHVESDPAIPQLGVRFLPKNVGYALVVSALADVFITRLKQTGNMISYTVVPTPDVPPQINTITFLIDPAYTLNGTLDGQVGSYAADDRFYQNVPEMRARQGSLFPASYLRLREALDLQRQIDQQDKQRESFFVNFDTSLAFGITDQDTLVAAQIDKPGAESVNVGIPSPVGSSASPDQQQAKLDQINSKLDGITTDLKNQQNQQDQLIQSKKDEIQQSIQDPQAQVHALRSFAAWQQKMEDLRVKAGKHNIVNSYVWDADGGFRTDAQEFASTIEHTIGSTVSYEASLGISASLDIAAIKTELNAAANIAITQTLTKSATATNALSLEVDASGVEGLGVTDENDLPLAPGDKVERYRFLTFYLEPTTKNFNDFFDTVVDPQWLASNDEDARALRQTQAGKPNAAWRVLHRVTFIERPALAGFGRDLRPVASNAAPVFSLEQAVKDLQQENQDLKAKLDEVLGLLRPKAAAAGG